MGKRNIMLAALLLGSCQAGQTWSERLDYAEINIRRAAQASSEMVDRVERLEARVAELERRSR